MQEALDEPAAASSSTVPGSPLRASLANAVVLADSKGDPVQAAKIVRGALRRADPTDPARREAAEFVAELDSRLGNE